MGDSYQKLNASDPVTKISRTVYNETIDMLRWWKSQGFSGCGPLKNLVDWDQTVFRAKNNTGGDVWSYSVVGIDGPIWTDADGLTELLNQTSIKVVEPTVDDHKGRWGVMLEAAASGSIGRCCLAGVVPVRVYCNAYTDTNCEVSAAQTVGDETAYLSSGSTGAEILWWEATGGSADSTIVWAIVRIGRASRGLEAAELKETLAPGETKDAYPLKSDWTANTDADPISVVDRLNKHRGIGRSGSTPGSLLFYTVIGGENVIVSMRERAMRCRGLLKGALAAGDATVLVDNIVPTDSGLSPVSSSSDTLTVNNRRNLSNDGGFAGVDNEVVWFEWDQTASAWSIYDMACKAS